MCVCVYARDCVKRTRWQGGAGRRGDEGRMWDGQDVGGGLVGGARTVLPCAPLVHVQRNCIIHYLNLSLLHIISLFLP